MGEHNSIFNNILILPNIYLANSCHSFHIKNPSLIFIMLINKVLPLSLYHYIHSQSGTRAPSGQPSSKGVWCGEFLSFTLEAGDSYNWVLFWQYLYSSPHFSMHGVISVCQLQL